MLNQIFNFIDQHELLPRSSTIVLGLSGGPDSIFLLHLLARLHHEGKINLVAAHLDHEWRADSWKDVDFCRKAAEKYSIPFVAEKASELFVNFKKDGSQEALGRKLRRTFLENVAHSYAANAIALGHHLQDQEETFFIRLIRGATLSGLVSMKPKNGFYIRPLLETSKEDILAYLKKNNIKYLEDPTNYSSLYLRNKIRHGILPKLQEVDPRFNQNFLRTLSSLQSAEDVLTKLTQKYFNEASTIIEGRHQLDMRKLFSHDPYLQRRILVHWLILEQLPFTLTERFLNEILRFLNNEESNEHRLHTTWKLIKEKDFVSVATKQEYE